MSEQTSPSFGRRFGRGVGKSFLPSALQTQQLVMQQLRSEANDPFARSIALMHERERLSDENKVLTEQESAGIEKAHNMTPGALRGMRASVASKFLPKHVFNPADGTMMTLPSGTQVFTPPGAAQSVQLIPRLSQFRAQLLEQKASMDKLKEQLPPLPLPGGLKHRVGGAFQDVANRAIAIYPEAAAVRARRPMIMNMIAKIGMGEVGPLMKQEQEMADQANIKITGTPIEQQQSVDIMLKLLDSLEAKHQAIISGRPLADVSVEPARSAPARGKPQKSKAGNPLGL